MEDTESKHAKSIFLMNNLFLELERHVLIEGFDEIRTKDTPDRKVRVIK